MEHSYLFVIILSCSLSFVQSFESSEDVFNALPKSKIQRVDLGVKRPVRFCQGFEDPTEIDCYMRSEIKSYVCTEPVTFNPCESLERVETYHYDHILHRCIKVNVPACEGQIIRVMTLLQCLVYCHNKDPFSLGKSRSEVYKLNQPKPYIVPEKNEENKEKAIVNIDKKQDNAMKNKSSETVSKDSLNFGLVNNKSGNSSSYIKDNVSINRSSAIIRRPEFNKITVSPLSTQRKSIEILEEQNKPEEIILQDIKANSETNSKEISKKSNKLLNNKIEMKEKMFPKSKPNKVYIDSIKKKMKDLAEKQISENLTKRFISMINNIDQRNKKNVEIKEKNSKVDEILKTDSKDTSIDYGFYLWDE